LDQVFSVKIEVVNNEIFYVDVIDIILLSILMKNSCFASRNLMRKIKFYQFLKNWDQFETKN